MKELPAPLTDDQVDALSRTMFATYVALRKAGLTPTEADRESLRTVVEMADLLRMQLRAARPEGALA